MHLVRIALVALTFAACKKSSPQQAIPSPVPSPVIATTASAPATDDAGAEESLELVATADPGSAIAFSTDQLWIHGKRIHVMSKNGDAIGPDLLKGLPVDPSKHTRLAGAPPHLFAFRRNDVACGEVDDPLLFVQRGDKWAPQRSLRGRVPVPPHAFLAWNGGALIVDSQIQACGWATSSPLERLDEGRGTTFTAIAPDGTVTHPTLDLDPTFAAWDASSADASLALVGTIGIRHDGGSDVAGTRDVVVMRRSKSTGGRFVANVIARGEGPAVQSQRTRIRELGDAALVLPAPARDDGTPQTDSGAVGGDEETWKGHASSIFLIEDGGVREVTVREPSEQDCTVRDAVRVGGDLFAHVSCLTSSRIARVRKDGPRTSLAMPKLERTADGRVASATPGKSTLVCHPTSLSASASDLVVAATCRDDEHSIAVVLRQRHR